VKSYADLGTMPIRVVFLQVTGVAAVEKVGIVT